MRRSTTRAITGTYLLFYAIYAIIKKESNHKKVKKIFFVLAFCAGCAMAQAQTITAFAASRGVAPVPAFGMKNPAASFFVNANLTKNIEFASDFNFDASNGNPWFGDAWLRYRYVLDTAGRWVAVFGVDWNVFFQPYTSSTGEVVHRSIRYPTGRASLQFKQSKENFFMFDIWYTSAIEIEYGTRGAYKSLSYTRTQNMKKFALAGTANLFHVAYINGAGKGFAASYDAVLTHNKTGVFLKSQLVHGITLGMQTVGNVSLGATLKLKG